MKSCGCTVRPCSTCPNAVADNKPMVYDDSFAAFLGYD